MNIIYTQLPILEGIAHIQAMAEEHWNEVPFGNFDMDLDLNVELYATLEQQQAAKFLAAVDEDKGIIVGYFVLLAAEMAQHTGVYQASTDAYYIDPEYRSAGVFNGLLNYAKEMCEASSIRFFSINVNPTFSGHEHIRSSLENKGFQLTEYSMTIEV